MAASGRGGWLRRRLGSALERAVQSVPLDVGVGDMAVNAQQCPDTAMILAAFDERVQRGHAHRLGLLRPSARFVYQRLTNVEHGDVNRNR